MGLSHPGKEDLAGLFIPAHHHGRIFFVDARQGGGNLILIPLAFWRQRIGNHGKRKLCFFKNDGLLLIAERIARGGLF